jgi:DNA topoisomerase-1
MAKFLVVVESPTKVKSLKKYLGKEYEVLASKGHVRDLPDKSLGVDVENGFEPQYVTIPGKEKVLEGIAEAANSAELIYLAPDPDREGEAIAWHIASTIKNQKKQISRVLIQEITKKGVLDAIARPQKLNVHKFESQQARRILDRLVGYQISPLLWKKVKRGLSAGRVQSVALKIICAREKEIRDFKSVEYWTIETKLNAKQPPQITTRLYTVDGEKPIMGDEKTAFAIRDRIQHSQKIKVKSINRRERKRNPVAPFTTSKLQQEAFRKLGFNVKRTMSVAQSLYEGVEITDEGPTGLITYMRTDSTRVSDDALKMVRAYITERFSADSLPAEPNQYKTKKSAQDAHEAIRPTSMELPPDKVASVLSKEQLSLYRLIWNRFIASQMKPAIYDQMTVEFEADNQKIILRATGSRVLYKGFMEVYEEGQDDERKRADDVSEEGENSENALPPLEVNDEVKLAEVLANQHFTQPPPRFNDSSLVKELDEKGIGRPSTYATILSTIVDRDYVRKNENRFEPTILGEKVNELLVDAFPDIVNETFTAGMEDQLDQIEEGQLNWRTILGDFYKPFSKQVKKAESVMRNVKASSEPTDIVCERCNNTMLIKWSSKGEFLGCSGYPKCRNTREFTRDGDKIIVKELKYSGDKCPTCTKPMIVRNGRYGEFIACQDYPSCPTVKSVQSDVQCPEKDCAGHLVPRRTKMGKTFWGCTNYPSCQYAVWNKPLNKSCEACQFPIVMEKVTKRDGTKHVCPSCKNEMSVATDEQKEQTSPTESV